MAHLNTSTFIVYLK